MRHIMKNNFDQGLNLWNYLIWIDGKKWHLLQSPEGAKEHAEANNLAAISPAQAREFGYI